MLTPEEWLDEIDNALEYRRRFGREDAWNQLELDYTNDPNSHTTVGPNLIYSMGDSLLSSLSVPNPEFVLTAEHPIGLERRPAVEALSNYFIRKLMMRREVSNSLLNGFLFGRAILKIGYDSEFGWSPFYDIGQNNNLLGMTLTQFNRKGERIESGNVTPGMPWLRSVPPQDFAVPWGTREIDDTPWAAHRIIRLNQHIKQDPKYKNKSRLEPQISMEDFMYSYSNVMGKMKKFTYKRHSNFVENKKPVFNELWEIHDKMTGRVYVISRDYDKFLRNDRDALQVAGLPFVSTTLVPHPRSFWGTPQAYYLGQIQATQYDISVQETKHRRLNVPKFLMHEDTMTEDNLNKLLSGDVGAVGIIKGNKPLSETVIPFPQASQIDLIVQSNANRSDARDIIGFSRNQLGEFDSSSRRTAREVATVEKGSQTRSFRRMNTVIDLYVEAIKKINRIVFETWKTPRYIMMGNNFAQFTGKELEGEFLYDVTLSTKRNLSIAQRKIETITMMAQFAQMGLDPGPMLPHIMDASGDVAFDAMIAAGAGGNRSSNPPQNAPNQGQNNAAF